MITISKPINDIGINGDEYLLGEDNKPLLFNAQKDAFLFLLDHNFTRDQISWLNFNSEEI